VEKGIDEEDKIIEKHFLIYRLTTAWTLKIGFVPKLVA